MIEYLSRQFMSRPPSVNVRLSRALKIGRDRLATVHADGFFSLIIFIQRTRVHQK